MMTRVGQHIFEPPSKMVGAHVAVGNIERRVLPLLGPVAGIQGTAPESQIFEEVHTRLSGECESSGCQHCLLGH